MRSDFVLCSSAQGFHRMHYVEWGDPAADRVVVCVHGLTRNGRDFDTLAKALQLDLHIVCPDVVGRGKSDWLQSKEGYAYPQYCADMTTLFARVTASTRGSARQICWLGTSMGGLIGLILASLPNTPIAKLILNDVGARIPKAALERLATYVGKDPRYRTLEEVEAYLRLVSAPFGTLTDEQWRHLTVHNAKQHPDGSWGMNYDPGIGLPFQSPLAEIDLWPYWDAITCPTLLLRGARSDLLPKDTAMDMSRRGPRAKLVEFENVGHAPMLMTDEQINVVKDFLLND